MSEYDTDTSFQIHDDNNVKGFFSQYRWLSNFYPCYVRVFDAVFPSTEHAYQFKKAPVGKFHPDDVIILTADEVKKWGRRIKVRDDWEKIKVDIMHTCVYAKFTQNPELRKKLLETGQKYLEETNWWNDVEWGVYYKTGKGKNMLGNLLMSVRNQIRIESL